MKTQALAILLLLSLPAVGFAQKMGHSNNSAPSVSQSIEFDGKALTLSYTSITWAGGQWKKALESESMRDGMRSRINKTADKEPLGSVSTAFDLMIDEQRVPAGEYELAFLIGDEYQWQLRLKGASTHSFDLALRPMDQSFDRLVLSLYPVSDRGDAALWVAFGSETGTLKMAAASKKAPSSAGAKAEGTPVNVMCPLMQDEVVDPEFLVVYEGKTVGFCCKGCVPDWADLTDAERAEALSEVVGG